ncbi:MAG TPA: glycoside hydrolase family 3 C-terminal domain-containing protein, partial [Thermaerobacter sp.]
AYGTALNPAPAEVEEAVRQAAGVDLLVVTTYNAQAYGNQRQLVERLLATGKPVVVAAMRNPYDAAALPEEVDAYLATYGYQPVSIEALARVLVGEVDPGGRLPVTIPGRYPFGAGLGYGPQSSGP